MKRAKQRNIRAALALNRLVRALVATAPAAKAALAAFQALPERFAAVLASAMPFIREICPHGKMAGECNACDIAADLAFDSAREDRIFGRR